MKKIRVNWSVTEDHSAEIEVPDDEYEEYIQGVEKTGEAHSYNTDKLLDLISGLDGDSFYFTAGREIHTVEVPNQS